MTQTAQEAVDVLPEDADQPGPLEKLAELELAVGGFPAGVVEQLAQPLDLTRVKRKPGQGSFEYLPHADIRRTLNRIFGYGGWGYTTDDVTIVTQGPLEKDGKVGVQACAIATVTLRLRLADGSWLEKGGTGEGTGNGYGPTALVEAPGKAAKEAESDALKRAAINLGDQFGLILYAKEERQQLQAEAELNAPADEAQRNAVLALASDKGKLEQTAELLAADAAEHGHVRRGRLDAIAKKLEALPDVGQSEEPKAEAPAEEPKAETDYSVKPSEREATKPLPDGEREVPPLEVQGIRMMAVRLGDVATTWFDEQAEECKAKNASSGYGPIITGSWLESMSQLLSQKLAAAGLAEEPTPTEQPTSEGDVAAAFDVAPEAA